VHDAAADREHPHAERVAQPVCGGLDKKAERIAPAPKHVEPIGEMARHVGELVCEPLRHHADHDVGRALRKSAREVERSDHDQCGREHAKHDEAEHAYVRYRDRQSDHAIGQRLDRRHGDEHAREHDAEEQAIDHALGDDRARRRCHGQCGSAVACFARSRSQHVRPRQLAEPKRQQQDREEPSTRHRKQASLRHLDKRAQ